MPNGKKGRRNQHNYDHTRDYQDGGDTRRVAFKGGKVSRRNNRENNAWRLAFLDCDVDMRGGSSNRMPKSQRRARPPPNHKHTRRPLIESPSGWYRVVIRGGQRYSKEILLKVIQITASNILGKLDPIAFKIDAEEVSFIVEDYKTAKALLDCDRRITMQDGWQLSIQVRPHTPMVNVSSVEVLAAMKAVLARRYTATPVKSLDLSQFHLDKALEAAGLFVPLNRSTVMTTVLQLIGDSVPDLVALNFSNNRLYSIEEMRILIDKVPTLKMLHLGNNRLRDIKCLDFIKGLPLTEFVLTDNPFVNRFRSKDVYVRAVRDRFPKVLKLDDIELPPPILFVDEETSTLPPCQASFMCDPSGTGATVTRQFLEQYYQLYDNDRASLSQAYHPNAEFSLSVMISPVGTGGDYSDRRMPPWNDYLPRNRNLMRCRGEQRVRQLACGRESIVAIFSMLPATTHDPTSFIVDLVVFTPQIIELVVMGVFKEQQNKKEIIRSFSRVFLLVPIETGGFCIINEMFCLQNATDDQMRKAFKADLVPAAAAVAPLLVAAAAAQSAPSSISTPSVAPLNDIEMIKKMITELSVKTKMNLAWSEKCLVETSWNLDQALYAFTELHSKGAIPAEAFMS